MSQSSLGGRTADTAKTSKGKLKTKNESKELVGSNDSRVALYVSNPGAKDVYLALGVTAVSGEGIYLKATSGPVKIEGYTGVVSVIASSEEPEVCYSEV
jgi:hypothetical protein